MSPSQPRTALWALALASAFAVGGCADRDDGGAAAPPAAEREASANGSAVRLTLDRTDVTPADRVTLRIELAAAPGWTPGAHPPELREGERLGEFTIAEVRSAPPTIDDQGRRLDVIEFTLLPFLPGDEQVPALDWVFAPIPDAARASIDAEGPVTIRTEPVDVAIRSLLDADATLADPKGIVDAPPAPRWPWYAGGAAAIVALAGAAVLLRRASEVRGVGAAPAPAHVEALEALSSLARLGLAERGAFDPYFTELSRILRRYIERRFDLHAPTLTTDEFLQQSRRSNVIRAEYVRELETFLRLADLVKFARHAPDAEEAGRAHDTARAFVESTAPVQSAAPTPEARP